MKAVCGGAALTECPGLQGTLRIISVVSLHGEGTGGLCCESSGGTVSRGVRTKVCVFRVREGTG